MANKAFIIGANTPGLEYAENDAGLMRECLEKFDYAVFQPVIEKTAILAEFDSFVDQCGKNDTVIAFFSGHGSASHFKGRLQLMIGENPGRETDRIDMTLITSGFERCKARHKLIILDCCEAGTTPKNWEPEYSDEYRILTAGERLEKAKEIPDLKAGFLTFHIHEALMRHGREISDSDGKIRLQTLYEWLKKTARKFGLKQDVPVPSLFGNAKHNFTLADTRLIVTKIKEIAERFAKHFGKVADIPLTGWPFPIQSALARLQSSDRISDYLNLFEAFVHFHFVTLASQFYWCLSEEEIGRPGPEIRPGLSALRETLTDGQCCGGMAWTNRGAMLSKSATRVKARMPFPEMSDVFQPETVSLEESASEDGTDTLGCWRVAQAGFVWQWLSDVAGLRKYVNPNDSETPDDATGDMLDRLADGMAHLFKPFHTLQLAMVSETVTTDEQRHVGIHCYWDETRFFCVDNRKTKRVLKETWDRPVPEDTDLVVAPDPPRPDWRWEESLLLYDPVRPYEKNVYLMPLGSRYRHSTLAENDKLPGLLDSVRWKEKQVAGVFQRAYTDSLREAGWQSCCADAEGATEPNLLDFVKRLCNSFASDAPSPVLPPRIAHEIKVFISYAREDYATAKRLYDDLKNAGISPWMDKVDLLPGQKWKSIITNTIQESKYFIALLSSNSVSKKGFVQKELKLALNILDEYPSAEDIFIIPIRLDDCRPLDLALKDLHCTDLFPSYDACLNDILRVFNAVRLQKDISRPVATKPAKETETKTKSLNSTNKNGGGTNTDQYDTHQTLKDVLIVAKNLAYRQLNRSSMAVKGEPWPRITWDGFMEKIWNAISEDAQDNLLAQFPQTETVQDALGGKAVFSRPSVGFVIAACLAAKRPHLLYTFVDFEWWQTGATPERRDGEQFEKLAEEQIAELLRIFPQEEIDFLLKAR